MSKSSRQSDETVNTRVIPSNHRLGEVTSSRSRLDFPDSIRGLAALWVLGCHTLYDFKGWAFSWQPYGHSAVAVFIVLSGFCLVLPVARTGSLEGGLWKFYFKRGRRILPPYYVAIVFSGIVLLWTHGLPAPVHFTKAVLVNALLLQDISRPLNAFDPPTWTVALEWKIYFLFPLLVSVWQRASLAAMLIFAAFMGYGITGCLLLAKPGILLDHSCPWYVLLFAMGVCAGVVASRPYQPARDAWPIVIGSSSTLLLIMLLAYSKFWVWLPLSDAATGALVASCLTLLGRYQAQQKPSLALVLLNWNPLVFLGTFAYSLYLIHMPVYEIIIYWINQTHLFQRLGLAKNQAPIALAAVSIVTIIFVSYLFFLAFERPFLNTYRKKKLTDLARDVAL